jgi:hypothetical protein
MGRFVGDERIKYKLSHLVFYLFAQKNAVGEKIVETLQQIKPHSYMYPINDPWTDFGRVSWSPWCVWGPMDLMSPSLRSGGLVGRHHDAYTRWYIDEALCAGAYI